MFFLILFVDNMYSKKVIPILELYTCSSVKTMFQDAGCCATPESTTNSVIMTKKSNVFMSDPLTLQTISQKLTHNYVGPP